MEELAGKVAVVTGAASGIGLALARAFAAEGMRLVLADLDGESLTTAVSTGSGTEVVGVPTDVSLPESVEALARQTSERFGAAPVVCNNAGVSAPGDPWQRSLSLWAWMLAVNLWGVVHGVTAFLPLLLPRSRLTAHGRETIARRRDNSKSRRARKVVERSPGRGRS